MRFLPSLLVGRRRVAINVPEEPPVDNSIVDLSSFTTQVGDGTVATDNAAKSLSITFGTTATSLRGYHAVTVGKRYRVSWSMSGTTGGQAGFGTSLGGPQYRPTLGGEIGTNSFDFVATSDTLFINFQRASAGTTTFSGIVVTEVPAVSWSNTTLISSATWSTLSTGVTVASNGTITLASTGTLIFARGTIPTVVGKLYRLSFTVGGNLIAAPIGTSAGGTQLKVNSITHAVGAHTYEFTATTTTTHLQFQRQSSGTATVSNINLQELSNSVVTTTSYQTPVTFASVSSTGVLTDFGIGGLPYYVTTTADNPTAPTQGMLRHAMQQSNRVVMFEVGGRFVIQQGYPLRITGSNLLIAGETAPWPGVIIQGVQLMMGLNQNLCLRHITIERGYDIEGSNYYNNNSDGMQITVGGTTVCRNVWIDHCSTFWNMDEAVQIWRNSGRGTIENLSITNCIFAEGLQSPEKAINPATGQPFRGKWEGASLETASLETDHNYGCIIAPGCRRVDMQYNLFSDMYWRQPVIAGDNHLVISNQVIHNCRLGAHFGGFDEPDFRGPGLITIDGYLTISGPNTRPGHSPFKFHGGVRVNNVWQDRGFGLPGEQDSKDYPVGTKIWAKNLYAWRGANAAWVLPENQVLGRQDTSFLTATEQKMIADGNVARPIDLPVPVVALSADELYERACRNAGPRPKHRSYHDERVIQKLKNKSSQWINHEFQVGGYSTAAQSPTVTRSLTNGTGRFEDGTLIPAFPAATDKNAVRAYLKRHLRDVQYDVS